MSYADCRGRVVLKNLAIIFGLKPQEVQIKQKHKKYLLKHKNIYLIRNMQEIIIDKY